MPPAIRSMLFVSGEKPDRFPKALAAGADLVCIDLEDAVSPACKPQARQDVFGFAAAPRPQGRLAVRLNGLRTREGLADVAALLASGAHVDAVVLPKVESAEELALFHAWAGDRCGFVVALIESPLGVENAAAIAAAARAGAPSLGVLMLGGADLSSELGAAFDWDGLLSARARLVNAARSAGLQAWDVPHIDLRDLDALAEETRRVARLGFDCKTAIHPSQVPVIHAAFAPAEAEIRWARALVAAHGQRGAGGQGAFLFEGRMVDAPVLARARRIVALAGD
ncbi:MAG: CoA ester lyase [Rubrivivax sp.]|nr:CoA ester lyase [Rubrivivax sp.]